MKFHRGGQQAYKVLLSYPVSVKRREQLSRGVTAALQLLPLVGEEFIERERYGSGNRNDTRGKRRYAIFLSYILTTFWELSLFFFLEDSPKRGQTVVVHYTGEFIIKI